MRQLIFAFAAAGLVFAGGCTKAEEAPVAVAVEPEAAAPAEPASPVIDAQALGIPTDADSIADGREIAMHQCANCHGLDGEDNLRADAPPLRYVLSIYPPESLAENFRAGIHVGHADMPDFVFGDLGMDVLLSYLVSIQETPPAPE
ncbi:MAG: cytochrome c [Hyphomonas sp.]|uniref:c-type cytochrome n=1 Tax=Hyphomonas sp. TaxID=87 RepID=UPI00180C0F0C|nr:c-type cytochrome [Hyphomonas sp.]MBU3921486.1 cytochrome c [Alphaproteobacteria bacterium]MBA3066967.1 cytochrome c [Hyphomonas sp.]MBU4060529.1 cytochrome c [Alphaproteobacteria bacterium]MBU4165797.1 cytochrome c [Alphaproteobacteria bacterium]MBU4567528.1 cytochrome c [Alphaproteobacteria bacterium]